MDLLSPMSDPIDIHQQIAAFEAKVSMLEQRLATTEARLQVFIEQSPVAIALFDTNMDYLMVSAQYLEDYGIKTNIIGRNHYEVFPYVPQRWKEVHQRCLKGVEESCVEDKYVFPNGQSFYFDWVVKPWFASPKVVGGLILIAEKVDDRVADKQKLIHLNTELKQSNQKLEEFAYAISHHLQEPLKSAIADAETVRNHLLQTQSHPVQEQADYFLTHTRRMQKMIDGLLEFARMGKQNAFHEVDISRIIQTVSDNLRHQIRENNVRLLFGSLPQVKANEFELVALFQNLIANGIKYNRSAEIEIIISVKRKGNFWEFCITDNGMGIPIDKQQEIFHLFRRLELDKHYEGTGIGLPICKRIVESLGGEIWIESVPQKGTSVYFTLPL